MLPLVLQRLLRQRLNAAASASAAAGSETNAAASATAAATSETNAATSETNAATSATAASTAQTAAETAKTAAETAETGAETTFNNFQAIYLGSASSDPSVDGNGDALTTGDLYHNSTSGNMMLLHWICLDCYLTDWSNRSNLQVLLARQVLLAQQGLQVQTVQMV